MAVQIMLEVGADRRASLHSYLHALKGMRKIGGVQSVQVIVWKDVSYCSECILSKEGQVSAGERPFLTGQGIYTSTRSPLFPKGWPASRCWTAYYRQPVAARKQTCAIVTRSSLHWHINVGIHGNMWFASIWSEGRSQGV